MTQAARQADVLNLIEEQGEVTIQALAGRYAVSEMTIRRDLDQLVQQGRAIRTHGGATAAGRVSFEFNFLKRRRILQKEKDEIGRRAAALVHDGSTLALDSGTTTLAVARALRGHRGITVVTTSLPIASELQYQPEITILLLGGFLRGGSPDLSGGLTERNLADLRVDLAILGADAVDMSGCVYSEQVDVANLLVHMAASAGGVYVVADHTKLGKRGLMRFGDLSKWAALVTDDAADASRLATLRKNGVTVLTQSKEGAP